MKYFLLFLSLCLLCFHFVYLLLFLDTFHKHPLAICNHSICNHDQRLSLFKHVSVKEGKWYLVLIQAARSTFLILWYCVMMKDCTWSCKWNKKGLCGKIRGWKRITPVLPAINILGNILRYISFLWYHSSPILCISFSKSRLRDHVLTKNHTLLSNLYQYLHSYNY